MAMVRYFCEELGVKNRDVNSDKVDVDQPRNPQVKIRHFKDDQDFDSNPGASSVRKVLLAANKAVAHTNLKFIDEIPKDHIIFEAINQVEAWVRERIFEFNGESLEANMSLEDNCIHREREIQRIN